MKKKWSALLLCACILTSGFQNGNVYAMEEMESGTVEQEEMQTDSTETEKDLIEEPVKTPEVITPSPTLREPSKVEEKMDVYEVSFDVEKESEYSWVCTSKDLKFCTVEQTESSEGNFQVKPVSAGTELLTFSGVDKQGVVKKCVTYKAIVNEDGTIQCSRQSYFSDDVQNSVKNWDKQEGAVLVFLMNGRASRNIKIADYTIIDYNYGHFTKYYDSNGSEPEMDFFRKGAQYITLQPKEECSTTMTVTYCDVAGSEKKNYKITYEIVVDKELNVTVMPIKYAEVGEDLTESIMTKKSNNSGYSWSYEIVDEKIADVTDDYLVYYDSTYSEAYDPDKYMSGYFGGWVTYYTVKGIGVGTTYICFTEKRDKEIANVVWYSVDVDEQKQVTITEIPYEELPEDIKSPQTTFEPNVSSSPVVSTSPDVSTAPVVSSSPVISSSPDVSNFPEVTQKPIKTPEVSTMPAVQSQVPTATAVPATIAPTTSVENGTISAEAATNGAITTTKAPQEQKKSVGTVKITSSIRKSVKKAIIKWKKLVGVKGYQVVIATDKKFSKNVKRKNVSETQIVLKSLRKGKKYYVKVRAYSVGENGKKVYGKYSNVKIVKKK